MKIVQKIIQFADKIQAILHVVNAATKAFNVFTEELKNTKKLEE